MHPIFSLVAAAGALNLPMTDTVLNSAPIAVSTCSVNEDYSRAPYSEFGPGVGYFSLELTFQNSDDVDATMVAFDVSQGASHHIVTDRGHFRKGVAIEHHFDDYTGALRSLRGATTCAVASVTFADGRRWSAQSGS